MNSVRPPAVAGTFYPRDADTLSRQIGTYMADAHETVGTAPKAIIAPHAGYVYSGPVAAHAYAHIVPRKDTIERVVLLGPCHRVPVRGLALSGADAFATPLGNVKIDHDEDAALTQMSQVQIFDATHAQEHSLEVHIPFLQFLIEDFKLIPLVVGNATPAEVDEVLEHLWGGPETLIVVSTDLSHYLDYDTAKATDQQTCQAIERLEPDAIGDGDACGRMPVKGLLHLAKRKGMTVRTLDLRSSGDTAGPRNQVVGYGAWALWEPSS